MWSEMKELSDIRILSPKLLKEAYNIVKFRSYFFE
jgi:hypothetical protein